MLLPRADAARPPSGYRDPPPPPYSVFHAMSCSLALSTNPKRWQDSGWRVKEPDVVGRRDLRGERAMSVDPPGCQDIDDAMHVTRKPDGKLEVRPSMIRCAV